MAKQLDALVDGIFKVFVEDLSKKKLPIFIRTAAKGGKKGFMVVRRPQPGEKGLI
jgi:hypothetical protein